MNYSCLYSCLYLAEIRSIQNRCKFATICDRKGYWPRGSESRTRKLRLHYGDFVQAANFSMEDKIASQHESTVRGNIASAKALNQELFEVIVF